MNAKRNLPAPHGVHVRSLGWIILFVTICAATGVVCGLLENEKIKVARQIRQGETEIQMHLNDASAAQIKINDQLGYFEIKSKLTAISSTLVPLTHGQVEIIREATIKHREGSFASNGPFFRQ